MEQNQNAQNDGKSSAIKQLLETLFLAIKMCTGFTTNGICMNICMNVIWFASDTAHIVFIHIPSAVKPVHIFMVRNRVSKSHLMAQLCFHRFVHFDCVPIYIFGFHPKQCVSD